MADILVLNAGSSSLKWRLFRSGEPADGGIVERIGEPSGAVADHGAAVHQVLDRLGGVDAVGHRIVHGGTRFQAPVVVDDEVLSAIRALSELAPLHNPVGVAGIEAARHAIPGVPQVAVFDTAYHATLPEAAATYALDREVAQRYGIRRYGFHGISVGWVAAGTAALLGRPLAELNLVVLHLGNGASATAVAGGRSVDTSMGLTPLEGLVMGTRTGDLDPAVAFHLGRAGLDLAGIEDVYLHRSGLAGLCADNDMRRVIDRCSAGDPAARLALDVYCHRIRKYVGAYHAVLGRLDAITFTAGVGEHSAVVRARCLAGLEPLGIAVDRARNEAGDPARIVSPDGSRVAVCVVPTDEERAIADEVARLLRA
ncbi:MAG: acetate kinase [Actinobacteria bacterium]|nr:MAG: acetate kinase [Actinomycetota bacterium]